MRVVAVEMAMGKRERSKYTLSDVIIQKYKSLYFAIVQCFSKCGPLIDCISITLGLMRFLLKPTASEIVAYQLASQQAI
jgi:hypothetical protein